MAERLRIDDKCRAQSIDKDKRQVRFLAQSTALASDDLVILPFAGRKHNKDYMKNPIVVPYHMRMTPDGEPVVVGSVVENEFTDDGMFQTVQFAETDRAEQYWLLYRDGHMRMVSIAWSRDDRVETDAKKMAKLLTDNKIELRHEDWNRIKGVVTEFRQRDLSLVAIGADPKALVRSGGEVAGDLMEHYRFDDERGLYLQESAPAPEKPEPPTVITLDMEQVRRLLADTLLEVLEEREQVRSVIAYKKYPLADVGMAWDAAAQVRKADTEQLEVICTWYDSANPDVKSSYKLPHHLTDGYKTVWRGVSAAMAVVFGARGGLKGEAAKDRKGIYNHLAKHYKDFDKEPPAFRADMTDEERERVLNNLLKEVTEQELDMVLLDLEDSSEAKPDERSEPNAKPNEPSKSRELYADLLKFTVEQTRGCKAVPDDLLTLAQTKNEGE